MHIFKLLGKMSNNQCETNRARMTRGRTERQEKLINCQKLCGFAECIHQRKEKHSFSVCEGRKNGKGWTSSSL